MRNLSVAALTDELLTSNERTLATRVALTDAPTITALHYLACREDWCSASERVSTNKMAAAVASGDVLARIKNAEFERTYLHTIARFHPLGWMHEWCFRLFARVPVIDRVCLGALTYVISDSQATTRSHSDAGRE